MNVFGAAKKSHFIQLQNNNKNKPTKTKKFLRTESDDNSFDCFSTIAII